MKRLLVICPLLAEWSESKVFLEALSFLSKDYYLEFMDPLSDINENTTKQDFFNYWKNVILEIAQNYNAYIGFSLGGIILQKYFRILEKFNKKIILVSTPIFSDNILKSRLGSILELLNKGLLFEAVNQLSGYVSYPDKVLQHKIVNHDTALLRLKKGLMFVLNNDLRANVRRSKVGYLHLIGEYSQLVNQNNIIVSPYGKLDIVPNAGMRVLQNNFNYCYISINKFLMIE